MKTVACFLLLPILFSSCLLKPKLTGKVWNLVDATSPANVEPGSFIRFYDDGTYTGKLMTGFRSGKWSLKGDVLTLGMGDNDAMMCTVTSLRGDALILRVDNSRLNADLRFEPAPATSDALTDPFSLPNNRWEIPARHREPDTAILARVRGHLRCELLYVQQAIDNKAESMSTTEFVTPLGFYGNGITLKSEAKVPAGWTRLFFDSADAHRGYEALQNAFRADIAVPSTQNVFLLYKGILSQLRDKVYLDTSAIIIKAAPSRP